MPLSTYHQKQARLSKEEIAKRTREKENELKIIFENVNFGSKNIPVRIAVLGCGDKRSIDCHRRIFPKLLHKPVEITTFDITISHLLGENGVFKHDCTKPLPFPNMILPTAMCC